MNAKRKRKLMAIISLCLIVSTAIGLILYALKQNINLFYTPTELTQHIIQPGQIIRIGGYVKAHSVIYASSGSSVEFMITDHVHDIKVYYQGLLPNLFREGQGVVVTGTLNTSNQFMANEVLAKHDEKYMPWSLAKSLQSGVKHP